MLTSTVLEKNYDMSDEYVHAKGDLSPLIKWAGGKYFSGVCDYLSPLYHLVKNEYPLYVAGFGGALGDVFYLNPDRFTAIDTVPEIVNFHNWVASGGSAYEPKETKAEYYDLRARFNGLNLAYDSLASDETLLEVLSNLDVTEKWKESIYQAIGDIPEYDWNNLVRNEDFYNNDVDGFQGLDSDSGNDILQRVLTLTKLRVEVERQINSMIYWLNKNCYNGVWRLNGSGKFNVPIDKKETAKLLTQGLIDKYKSFLSRGEYYCDDFRNLRDHLPEGKHFIYFDPPYHKTFGGYSKGGFSIQDQTDLAIMAGELVNEGHFVVASNSDSLEMCDLYSTEGFNIQKVYAKRRLSCKGKKRQSVPEMLAIGCKNMASVDLSIFG